MTVVYDLPLFNMYVGPTFRWHWESEAIREDHTQNILECMEDSDMFIAGNVCSSIASDVVPFCVALLKFLVLLSGCLLIEFVIF